MEDSVLTTTETAKLLGISVRTAQLLIESGKLPSWKTPGGHRRVHRSDVDLLMDQARGAGHAASATVLVVTTAERLAPFRQLFAKIGHVVPQFVTSPWSAAMLAGSRPPAIVVVDLEGWRSEGMALLQSIAMDSRLKNTDFLAILPEGETLDEPLPSTVRLESRKTLAKVVKLLVDDPRDLLSKVSGTDFPVAPNEASRLQAVKRSGLVATPAEAAFDRVTWLAAEGLKSPIALMTVLTPDLQWFKSRQGLDLVETPRSWAFCNHTVLQTGIFEVDDLAAHPSFSHNPAVAEAPHFRFYAGAPVYDPDGFALGSICIIDFHPRHLDETQRRILLELAAIASDEVKLRDAIAKT